MRHVLDLAPLYQKPNPETLVETLQCLALRPASFDGNKEAISDPSGISEDGVPRYLTAIIGSQLAWIEQEPIREHIWNLASLRLAERAGRSARPSFHRSFKIQTPHSEETLEIKLLEPSMTEDNLGLKTWASAYLLAKRFTSLIRLIPSLNNANSSAAEEQRLGCHLPRILELGAGTGLVGLALSALIPCEIHLTDMPAIVPNLVSNIALNDTTVHDSQPLSKVSGFSLDWSMLTSEDIPNGQRYDIVVAADPIYSPEHPEILANAIDKYLKKQMDARVVVELPLRERYTKEREDLKRRMREKGLELLESGEECGFDDWDTGATEIECWWGVWRRVEICGRKS